MSCVHYKFSSKLNYDTVTFDGLHISLADLKKQIMGRERLKAADCDLQITNAQTQEEYTDETALIPKNSSVIVRRIPIGGVRTTTKTFVVNRNEPVSGTSKAIDDASSSISLAQLSKTANLAEANASEEDKIRAMMSQSGHDYDPSNYMKKPLGPPPPTYTCFRCLKPGHYIKNCPTNGDKSFESAPRIKKSTGIPRSFMVEVEDPNMKGAMLTNTGKYAIPTIDAVAYAMGKKEKPPFLPDEQSSSSEEEDPIPDELLCMICKDIMADAVVIPCCGNSYCDDCIRTALLESDEHTCPTCHQNDVSPDNLIANKFLRQAVNNFKNETGYTKRTRKQQSAPQQRQQPTAPALRTATQPTRPLTSRQQDPLIAPSTITTTTAAITTSAAVPATTSASQTTTASLSTAPSATRANSPPNAQPQTAPLTDPPASQPVPAHKEREKSESAFHSQEKRESSRSGTGSAPVTSASSIPPPNSLLIGDKGYHVPVLGQAPPGAHSLPPPTPLMRANIPRPSLPRPHMGWDGHSRGRHPHNDRPPRNQGPSLASSGPVYVPPPTPLFPPPPPHGLQLPPGVPPPQFPPQFPPGQPPTAGFNVPPPGFPSAPATVSAPWVAPAIQGAHASALPAQSLAPPLSKEEFYREQRRLKEEEKNKIKFEEFTNDFAKELLEYKKIQKERKRSYSRSKSPYSGSSYSKSSYSYSKSRSSSRSRSYSRSFSRSRSRSFSRSPSYQRKAPAKGRAYRSRSRSHGYPRSRSRSPYRRYHSRSRSPTYRPPSPNNKRLLPQIEGEREFVNRYREFPPYDVKALYGRQPDLRDPFEKEAFREWERKYRDWYEKYYKGCAVNTMPRPRSPLGRENFQDNRYLLPPQARREHSPFNRGHRDNYPPPLVPRLRPLSNYPEKVLPREAHIVKESRRSKEREAFVPAGDSRGNKHKKHRKKRKEESEGPSKPVVEPSRKRRDSHGEDVKRGEPLFVPTNKDDATPVRDEPMDAESVAPKSLSDKDRRDKPRAKPEKTKRRTEAVPPKKRQFF